MLIKVTLGGHCHFGSQEDTSRLFASLAQNRTIADLCTLHQNGNGNRNLAGGGCLSSLL
jgi:hypothetical protein